MSKRVLRIYSRIGCHLCEDMLAELVQYQQALQYQIEVFDVDDDSVLFEQYNTLVPVVFLGDEELFRYFFEYATLVDALGKQ